MALKKRIYIPLLILIFFITVALAIFGWAAFSDSSPHTDSQSFLFAVPAGSSVKSIIKDLEAGGYIRSVFFAYAYARIQDIHIQSGTYRLSTKMTSRELLDYLQKGVQEMRKITIPEGLSLQKTARLLDDSGILQYDNFINCAKNIELLKEYSIPASSAEGYLFPDTYLFDYGVSAERVLRAMLDNFFIQVQTIAGFPDNPQDIFNTIILASIVEREYRLTDEAPIIAGIFFNRLKINMALQSCATIEYIITEVQGKPHPNRLFTVDLQIDHPYNTYKWRGLPPGPIANPGIVALHAACTPKKTDFLYFRLANEETGKHVFSKTLQEHGKAGLLLKRAAGN